MLVAFRDDDTSYFTKPEEIDEAYDFLEEDEPVSLSVVPYTVPIHKDNVFPYGENIPYGYYDIGANKEIVEYLKKKINEKKIDVLLHGYSHEYKKINNQWMAEMKWKDSNRIKEEIKDGKKKLEELLGQEIKVFVAPNNSIDKKAIEHVAEMGMDYSGIIMMLNRKINLKSIVNFVKRWVIRLVYNIPYPGILNYGTHKEMVAYTLDSYNRLIKEYEKCKKNKQPFVVYSHYWKINSDKLTKQMLKDLYRYIKADGAKVVSLTECFKESK